MKNFLRILLIFSILNLFFVDNSYSAKKKRATGLIFDDESYRKQNLKVFQYKSIFITPKSFSLKNYAPEVGNQGDSQTCSAWAISYAARSIVENIENQDSLKVTPFSPGFMYAISKRDSDKECTSGLTMDTALRNLVEKGSVPFKKLTSNCPLSINQTLLEEASNYKVKGFTRLYDKKINSDEQNITKIKIALSEKRPVVFGMYCCEESFQYLKQPLWDPLEETTSGGHAMTIVGYDDTKYGGAFEIINSWGKNWGNKGFFWLKYEELLKRIKYAYEIIPNQKELILGENIDVDVRLIKSNNGEIYFKYENGAYKSNGLIKSGDKFRIFLTTKGALYAYAFGYDDSGSTYKLFPPQYQNEDQVTNISPLIDYKTNEIVLPNPNEPRDEILVDNNIGTDRIIFLFSKEEIDVNTILNRIQKNSDIKRNLTNYLSSIKRAKDDSEIKYKTQVGLKTNIGGTDIVPIIIELKHE